MFKNQHLLIICTVWPEPASSAAGSRMLELISLFLQNGCVITVACDAKVNKHSYDFSELAVTCIALELNNSSADAVFKNLTPQIVIFDRFITEEKYGWRITEQCPDALKILDTEDLHCLRKARQNCFKLQKVFTNEDLFTDFTKREIASIYRCDVSLIISTFEMDLLESFFNIDPSILHYLPFLSDELKETEISLLPSFLERKHFVSIGNFLHEPNVNSVLYLKQVLWPLIKKKLPDAELHIYGAYANDKINALHNTKQGFLIKGRVDNSNTAICSAKVMLAPLRIGAGLKGKLLEAMQCGTPSITTTIGAEGMHSTLPWNGNISDSATEFANNAIEYYINEIQWKVAQKNGIEIINQLFLKQLHTDDFVNRIKSIQRHLIEHRKQNFIGSMLLYHTMASTKYMAKWIEVKNKTIT